MTAPKGASTAADGSRRYMVTGLALPSANTVLGALDKPGLNTWKLKRVAAAIASDPGLLAQCRNGEEWKAVRSALDTAPSPEADLGTAVHLWTERWDLGEDCSNVPPEVAPFLTQWQRLRDAYGLIPVLVERTVAHPELGYAGTLDRVMATELADVAEAIHPGCRLPHVLDVKTGKGVWPDHALQASAYANAPHLWDPDTDTLAPAPPVCTEVAVVASVHADEATLVPLWLPDAWEAFKAALTVWRWAAELGRSAVGHPLPEMADAFPW